MRTILTSAASEVKPVSRAPEGMAGLAKGMAILEAFGPGQTSLTVADAARLSGATRAAARRCLLTLASLGYLIQDGRLFRPLPRLVRLATNAIGTVPLIEAARPVLAAACAQTGESVSLAVLDRGQALFVARAEARHIVSTGVRIGASLPLWCSATGRVLLASLPLPEAQLLAGEQARPQRTSRTLTDLAAIMAAIGEVRAEDVAFSDEELELGMRSMAVAVRDAQGHTLAAMSLSTSSARLSIDGMRQTLLPILRRHAAMLERAL